MTLRDEYDREGFVVHEAPIPQRLVEDLVGRVEQAIEAMADDLGVSRDDYLDAVCRWNTPNAMVAAVVAEVADGLRTVAAELLDAPVRPLRASVFRKSDAASLGTHAHQDAAYWVRPSSSRYEATTWLALDPVDEQSGALRVLPGSHAGPVEPPVDYLAPDFVDRSLSWGNAAQTLSMRPGSAVTFHPKLWHASHGTWGHTIRRAVAVRWTVEGRTPVVVPPPEASEPAFGMYSSGARVQEALSRLGGVAAAPGAPGIAWAMESEVYMSLPNPDGARRALSRLLTHLRACERHHAADQQGLVWEEVRDLVVAPVLGWVKPASGGGWSNAGVIRFGA